MSIKIFGVKGVGGVISIVLPIAMWLIEMLWQKDKGAVGYRGSVPPNGDTAEVKEV
jgi:hypothetical protein